MKNRKIFGNYFNNILSVTALSVFLLSGCGPTVVSASEPENAANTSSTVTNDTSSQNPGTESTSINADGSFNIDSVGEFTIRFGVNNGDQIQILKIVDDHTGFLKERGINLETTEFAAGINTIDAITLGQLDVGLFADYAGVNRIGNTLNDTELRAFTNIGVVDSYELYVNPETIKTGEDLLTANLVSQAGVVFEYEYGKLFEYYNLDPKDVHLVNVTSAQEALSLAASGGGDAYWANPTIKDMFAEQGWIPFISIDDIGAPMYTYNVANESYLTEHRDEVTKFLIVSEEAFRYIDENLDEVAGWVEAEIGLKKDLVIKSWKEREHKYSFGQAEYEALKNVKDWCFQNGNFDTDYDVADFINTDSLKAAFPDRVNWER